jgi:ribonuclease HI
MSGNKLYYAICNGKKSGIIVNTWDECKQHVSGYKGAIFKKFKTQEDAQKFIDDYNVKSQSQPIEIQGSDKEIPMVSQDIPKRSEDTDTEEIIIYTDGSLVRTDGQVYAGYGIYIPSRHFENSRRLTGKKTNNRAELMAIISAIQMYKVEDNVCLHIYTDSSYSIRIFGETGKKYQLNHYMKNTLHEVPNSDLVKIAVDLSGRYLLRFTHINSHTSNTDIHSKGNDRADTLAVRGAVQDYIHSSSDISDFKLTFGKHKHQSIQKVPTSYLAWIASSPNFEELCHKKEEYRLEKEIVLHYLSNS